MITGDKHQVVLTADLHVPAHLVDISSHYQFLFVVIYARAQPMPLAVMKEPFQVKVNSKSRRAGFYRKAVVSLDKLEYMQLPGTMNSPPAHTMLRQALEAVESQGDSSAQLYEFKVLIDRDGQVGGEQIVSSKRLFYLGQTDLSVDLVMIETS